MAAAIESLDETAVARLLDGEELIIAGESIGPDDITVWRRPLPGVVVASDDRLSVALDTTVTPDLALEGLAREIVKAVQSLRRTSDLDVSDRITLSWSSASPRVREAMTRHADWIAAEVLAVEVNESAGAGERVEIEGETLDLEVEARRPGRLS